MDDPRRLLDDPEGSPLARALLASAQGDAPSSTSRARVARRIGIAAVLAAGTGLGSEAGALAVTAKLSAVVLALGGIVGLAIWRSPPSPPVTRAPAAHVVRVAIDERADANRARPAPVAQPAQEPAQEPAQTPAALQPANPAPLQTATAAPRAHEPAAASVRVTPARPAMTRAPARPASALAARPAGTPAPVPGAVASPEPAPAVEEPAPAPPMHPAPAPSLSPASPPAGTAPAPKLPATPSRLAAEVALVDRARSCLTARDHRGALAALADYHQRFAPGDLDAEADVVMIETVIGLGDAPRARALGAAFLARFPRSPLVQRVHSLVEQLTN